MKTDSKTENELIAEFMGFIPRISERYGKLYKHPDLAGEFGDKAMQFLYDTSWDALMPAWDKFASLTFDDDALTNKHSDLCVSISEKILEVDIFLAHERLAEGIKWYNQQTKLSTPSSNEPR